MRSLFIVVLAVLMLSGCAALQETFEGIKSLAKLVFALVVALVCLPLVSKLKS